jgi:hypothetical protein
MSAAVLYILKARGLVICHDMPVSAPVLFFEQSDMLQSVIAVDSVYVVEQQYNCRSGDGVGPRVNEPFGMHCRVAHH